MVALVENTHPGQQGIGVGATDYPYEPLMTVGAILYGCPQSFMVALVENTHPGQPQGIGVGATDYPYEPLMTVGAILYGCPGRLFFASCLSILYSEPIKFFRLLFRELVPHC